MVSFSKAHDVIVSLKKNILDFDMAIQRMCVQRGPDDNEDRCAYTVYNSRKVFICFCQGDLCNTGTSFIVSKLMFLLFPLVIFSR